MKPDLVKFAPVDVPNMITNCTITFNKNKDGTYAMQIHRDGADGYIHWYRAKVKFIKERVKKNG